MDSIASPTPLRNRKKSKRPVIRARLRLRPASRGRTTAHFSDGGAKFFCRSADVAEEHRQRQEGAGRMVDPDEGRMGDDVERLLAAVVRMRAPTDVRQQAGGTAQPLLLQRLVEAG